MMRRSSLAVLAMAAACSAPVQAPPADRESGSAAREPADDGSYLAQIDPLGGHWRVQRLGEVDLTPMEAWVSFSSGGFLNHGAGCSGGHPAFYRIEGERLTVTRREPARNGRCEAAAGGDRVAAIDSEQRLTAFLDQVAAWSRPDENTLILVSGNGLRAVLTRPPEPHPDFAGRWVIESIGGAPLITERRPPTVVIGRGGVSAHADCNSMGGAFEIPAPGRFALTGPLVSTQIGCPPEDAAEDALIGETLVSASGYRVDGDRLVFTGGPGMVLRRPPAPDRRLAGAYEACGDTLLGAYHEGPITLAIDARTMTDNAGCVARYSANGPRLTLSMETQGPPCDAERPPVVPGESVGVGGGISPLAVTPPDGFAFDAQGRLMLRTELGLLGLCRQGAPPPFGA